MKYEVVKPIMGHEEGDVIELTDEEAQALGDAVKPVDAEEAQEDVAEPEAAAVTRSLETFRHNLKGDIAKATELAVSKLAKKSGKDFTAVPASVKSDETPIKGTGHLIYNVWKASQGDVAAKNMLRAHQNVMQKSPLGMSEGTNSAGGYDVKPEWFEKVWDKIRDYPKLVDMTTKIPAKSSTFNIPAIDETSLADGSRHGGVLAYYVSEGSSATSSYPALTQVTATLNTLVILNYVTLQLLQDANIEGIEKLVNEKCALEILWQQNDGVINGSGTGAPKGILNQAALVTVNKSTNDGSTHAVFGFDDLAAMYKTMYPPSRNSAVWIMNPECYNILLTMTFPSRASGAVYPAWSLTYNGQDAFPLKLFGRPVIECMNNPQLGAAGDIIFADLSQLITYERPGIQVDVSDQLQFATLQLAYRTVYRFDIRSPWTAALTTVDGNYSYSPFVCLQSRGT